MARHDQADRVAPNRRAHRTNCFWVIDLLTDLAVTGGLAVRNFQQRLPHRLLECGAAVQIQRDIERAALAREILLELTRCVHQYRMHPIVWPGRWAVHGVWPVGLVDEPDAGQAEVRGGDADFTQRCVYAGLNGGFGEFHENLLSSGSIYGCSPCQLDFSSYYYNSNQRVGRDLPSAALVAAALVAGAGRLAQARITA